MKSAAIIIPVHNRRALTLACLGRLTADRVDAWADVLVVDDGSTDGTAEAIRRDFPGVEILPGDGNLWWTGAIALGMQHALDHGAEFIFWLNDDCAVHPGALSLLRDFCAQRRALISGTCLLPGSTEVVYGGLRRQGFSFSLLPLQPGRVEECDAVSGNIVACPAALVRAVGLPDARNLPHGAGDIDYALRARAAGWPVLVAHDVRADAEPSNWSQYSSWLLGDIPVARIWTSAWDKRSYGYFPAQWVFLRRHWGLRGALHALGQLIKRPPIMLVRLLVPRRWLRSIWGSRSRAWQEEQRLRAALRESAPSPKTPPAGPSA